MAKIKLEWAAPYEFESGQCHGCPLSYMDDDAEFICPLLCSYEDCPLEVVEDE